MTVQSAIQFLQRTVSRRFGKTDTSIGAATLTISGDRVELTNEGCIIEARGHCRVATVLRRKRRAK